MAAAEAGNSTIGIPQSVGKEFMAADEGGKLPEKVGEKRKGKMPYTHSRARKE